jgi:hypothetical protein
MTEITSIDRTEDRTRFWEMHDKDSYVCPDCGRTRDEHGRRWEVHHLDGVAGNVVGLCLPCHKIRHGAKRRNIELEAWKDEFLQMGKA